MVFPGCGFPHGTLRLRRQVVRHPHDHRAALRPVHAVAAAEGSVGLTVEQPQGCLLYTSPLPVALLLYRDFTTLCGYFVGAPEKLGNGQWRMEITLCDYDFTALYEEQSTGYEACLLYTSRCV